MAITQLRKFSWTDTHSLDDYWGYMAVFPDENIVKELDGKRDDCARYDHNHTSSQLRYDDSHLFIDKVNKDKLYGLDTKQETMQWVEDEISRVVLKINWRTAVNYWNDLAGVPNPKDGDMVPVLNDSGTPGTVDFHQGGDYRYHDDTAHKSGQPTGWYLTNSTKVPLASSTLNGLLSTVGFNKLQGLVSFPGFGGGSEQVARGNHSHTAADVGAIPISASCNKNWAWSGQPGQPTWLWGGNDPSNVYVYNPANFSVNRATYANNSDTDHQMNGHWIRGVADIAFSSDVRLKTNLIPIGENFYKKVLNLQPYQYEFKSNLGEKRIGYVAQQVEEMFPDLVKKNKDGELSLSYRELMILKIEALICKVNKLQEEIEVLKRK